MDEHTINPLHVTSCNKHVCIQASAHFHLNIPYILKTLGELNANKLILHVGTNNIATNDPVDLATRIESIGLQISASCPSLRKITLSSIVPRGTGSSHDSNVKIVNGHLRSLHTKHKWSFIDNENINPNDHLEHDGIHLNPSGIKALARNIIGHLRGNLQRGDPPASVNSPSRFSHEAPIQRREQPFQRREQQSQRREQPFQRREQPFQRQEQPFQRQEQPFQRREQPFQRQEQPFQRREQPFQRQEQPFQRREQPFQRREWNQCPTVPSYSDVLKRDAFPTEPMTNHFSNYSGCYNCGEQNHNRQMCRFDGAVRCRNCSKFGHKAKFCFDSRT